jgi:molybdenum cofactor cytidylyltransferase
MKTIGTGIAYFTYFSNAIQTAEYKIKLNSYMRITKPISNDLPQETPNTKQCDTILSLSYGVPERVRTHGRKVAQIAVCLGRALAGSGLEIDLDRIRAGALLHDMAKGVKNHALVAERMLNRMGFGGVAPIVGAHTDLILAAIPVIAETEIVHLADKLVKEDRIVTIEEKFQWALGRWRHDPIALACINRRRTVAFRLQEQVEAKLGLELKALLNASSGTAGSGV